MCYFDINLGSPQGHYGGAFTAASGAIVRVWWVCACVCVCVYVRVRVCACVCVCVCVYACV